MDEAQRRRNAPRIAKAIRSQSCRVRLLTGALLTLSTEQWPLAGSHHSPLAGIGQKQSFDTDHFERAAAGEDCRGRTIPAQSAFLWRLGLKYFSCGGTVTSGTLVLPSSIKCSSGIAARMGHENSTQLLST